MKYVLLISMYTTVKQIEHMNTFEKFIFKLNLKYHQHNFALTMAENKCIFLWKCDFQG